LAEGLRDLGWIEGKNLSIERRVCSGDAECLAKSAVELAALKVEVIVALATASTQAAKAATSSIPIVFAATGDPVGQGFVANLAHPGAKAVPQGIAGAGALWGFRVAAGADDVGARRVARYFCTSAAL
jgi:ABC-type uncharacterized transport system substrate-binding protein